MKFEVTDKREQREGLISKKTVYYCSARCELTDDEFAAIEEMAGIEEWTEQEIGLILSDGTRRIAQTIRSWYDLHLKKHMVFGKMEFAQKVWRKGNSRFQICKTRHEKPKS